MADMMAEAHERVSYDQFSQIAPDVRAGLLALGKATAASGLDKSLVELVKMRVSQINGCGFCLQIHVNLARKIGIAQQKLDLLAVWREAGLFSPPERAALAWAETLTALPPEGASDAAYAALRAHFTEAQAVFLTAAIGTINMWNRIGVALRFAPPPPA